MSAAPQLDIELLPPLLSSELCLIAAVGGWHSGRVNGVPTVPPGAAPTTPGRGRYNQRPGQRPLANELLDRGVLVRYSAGSLEPTDRGILACSGQVTLQGKDHQLADIARRAIDMRWGVEAVVEPKLVDIDEATYRAARRLLDHRQPSNDPLRRLIGEFTRSKGVVVINTHAKTVIRVPPGVWDQLTDLGAVRIEGRDEFEMSRIGALVAGRLWRRGLEMGLRCEGERTT